MHISLLTQGELFTGESNIMDRGHGFGSNSFMLKHLNDGIVFYKQLFASQDVN